MRKVFYDVEGTVFTSYEAAINFKEMTEDLEDRSVDFNIVLEDVAATSKQAKSHRAKVDEVLHAGFSVTM